MKTIQIYGPFKLDFNCDSDLFIILAEKPDLLLKDSGRIWQSRPLYPVLGWFFSHPFRLLQGYLISRDKSDIDNSWSREHLPALMSYILVNFLFMVSTVVIFTKIMNSKGINIWTLLPMTILLVNGITKYSFWTPHLQIFNIFMPVSSIYLFKLILEKKLSHSSIKMSLIGLMTGLGSLIYGAFGVMALGIILCILWEYRKTILDAYIIITVIKKIFLFAVSFLTPLITWYYFVKTTCGFFYSHEVVKYRQFTWIIDSMEKGLTDLMLNILVNISQYLDTLFSVILLPCIILVAIIFLIKKIGSNEIKQNNEERLYQAIIIYACANIPFYALMGYYQPRLSWTVVPALLIVLSLKIRHLNMLFIGKSRVAFQFLIVSISVSYYLYWYLR